MGFVEVSVVIPTRNRPQELAACLTALQAQRYPPEKYEVLICDDGSEADIQSVIERFQSSGLNVRHLRQSPKGPAAARNLGIRHAHAPIVAMTDSDTVPHPDWLAQLLLALSAHPQAIAVEG